MKRLAAAALTAWLAACSAPGPNVYQSETFSSSGTYSHDYRVDTAAACEAARRALLSQGYMIDPGAGERSLQLQGRKSFQPATDAHIEIRFNVVCVTDASAGRPGHSTVFVNALQDRYALKKVNNSASLGVGALGSVSVPFTGGGDSLVKVGSETIAAGQFYDRFFALIERYLILDDDEGGDGGTE